MRALGAEPVVTPLSDVYLAIKEGLVDGEESVPSNIATQRLYEVQAHLTVSNHAYLAYAVIVNKTFWDRLPSDVRTTLQGALKDATTYANGIAEAENMQALERIRASGKTKLYTLSPAEAAQWRSATRRVYSDTRSWISAETLTAMQSAAGFSP
jgi:C4-dicarboxylate-binding protein DctP